MHSRRLSGILTNMTLCQLRPLRIQTLILLTSAISGQSNCGLSIQVQYLEGSQGSLKGRQKLSGEARVEWGVVWIST